MAGFNIDFGTVALDWKLNELSLSSAWLDKLEYVTANKTIDNPRRYYGLPAPTFADLHKLITEAVKDLNCLGFPIPLRQLDSFDRNWINYLHDYFADHHGRDYEEFSQQLNQQTVEAWNKLHVNIHRYEVLLDHVEEPVRVSATWRAQGECMETYNDQDYDHFTWDSTFGDVFIGYREVGKSAFDVYLNKDRVDQSVLVNSAHWCADFRIHFFDMDHSKFIRQYWDWHHDNIEWFNQQFGPGHESKVSPGYYPVAKLITAHSRDYIKEQLTNSQGIVKITIKR